MTLKLERAPSKLSVGNGGIEREECRDTGEKGARSMGNGRVGEKEEEWVKGRERWGEGERVGGMKVDGVGKRITELTSYVMSLGQSKIGERAQGSILVHFRTIVKPLLCFSDRLAEAEASQTRRAWNIVCFTLG